MASASASRCVESDLFATLPGRYDLILCNPPYVNDASMAALPAEYRAEPALALAGGADGMDLIRRIVADAPDAHERRRRAGARDRPRARALRARLPAPRSAPGSRRAAATIGSC